MLSPLAQRVWTRSFETGLLSPGTHLLLAVSGGPDSMALLEIMREIAGAGKITLHVGHVHHMLRPSEGTADQTFVRTYARFVEVPCTCVRVDVPEYRRTHGGSLEEIARALRYEALERIRVRTGTDQIITAHHADDQIETVLMRVVRGTDVPGLAGILPRLSIPPVVRPMLHIPKRELQSYLEDRRIPYRHDSSNTDVRLTRNRIRLEVIPRMLRSGDAEMLRTIPRLADASRKFSVHLRATLPLFLAARTGSHVGQHLVHVDAIRSLPPNVRRSYIGMVLTSMGVGLSAARIENVLQLLDRIPGKRIEFRTSGMCVTRDRHHLVFGRADRASGHPVRLTPGESVLVNGAMVRSKRPAKPPERFLRDPSIAWVDAASVAGGMTVRPWRSGDRFQPLGMRGKTKKVSDFLRDQHIPLYYRESIPVVTHRGKIVWVCGLRADDRFKVTLHTRRAIQLSFHLSV